MRHIRQRGDIAHLGERVSGRFGKQQSGVGFDCGLPFTHIGLGNKGGLHTKLGKLTTNQLDSRPKHGVRANHMVATFEQSHAHEQNRPHAGGRANARFGALQSRQALLHAADRGVAQTGIGIALFFARKSTCRSGRVRLDISTGEIQGFRVFAVLAARHGGTHRLGVTVQIDWRWLIRHGSSGGWVGQGQARPIGVVLVLGAALSAHAGNVGCGDVSRDIHPIKA